MTERYHRRDVGHIDLQITFDDPKAYTRAWTLSLELNLIPDNELIEYVCENERDSRHLIGASREFSVPADVLAQYRGTYEAPGYPPVTIYSEGDRFMIDTSVGKIPLFAESETLFTMEGTGVEFFKDSSGRVTRMVEHWTEGDRNYTRRK